MISLALGDSRDTWEKFIQPDDLDSGLPRPFDEAWQAKLFCVPGYPSYWLIGPDGKVLAEGFQSNPIRPILDKALSDLK